MRGGQQVGAPCHARNAERGEGLGGGLKMPIGTVEETSVGLLFQAARPVGTELSSESLHVNLSLLQSGRLVGKEGCVYRGWI